MKQRISQNLLHKHIFLFDSECIFCNKYVNFFIKRDTKGLFIFSALKGKFASQMLLMHNIQSIDYKSSFLIISGKVYKNSDAIILGLKSLGGWWNLLSVFLFVPRVFRDFFYLKISKNRHLFFNKSSCTLISPEQRKRFID